MIDKIGKTMAYYSNLCVIHCSFLHLLMLYMYGHKRQCINLRPFPRIYHFFSFKSALPPDGRKWNYAHETLAHKLVIKSHIFKEINTVCVMT